MSEESIPTEELKKGLEKCVHNAKGLYKDAVLLKENNRLSRATSLFKLSIEESGKTTILYRAILLSEMGEKVTSKYLNKEGFANHYKKAKSALDLDIEILHLYKSSTGNSVKGFLESKFSEEKSLHNLNWIKNISLYVDFFEGRFISPEETINTEILDTLEFKALMRIEAAKGLIQRLDSIHLTAQKIKEIEENPKLKEQTMEKIRKEIIEFLQE